MHFKMVESTGILGADEKKGARKVLTAAALTYVAALAASILQLHPDVTVVADEAALKLIREKGLL